MMNKKTNKETATKAATSGKIGKLEWNFVDGVLTISGDGEIPDFDDYTSSSPSKYKRYTPDGKIYRPDKHRSPWYTFRENIAKIVFRGNITKKSLYVFHDLKNLSSVTFESHPFPNKYENIIYENIIDRAMQGYTLVNIWNIDSWFIEQIYRMLQELRQKSYGFGSKEWVTIVERMTFCFKEANKETCSVKNEFEAEYFNSMPERKIELEKSYYGKREEIESYREAMLNEGLELFCKHFRSLWW